VRQRQIERPNPKVPPHSRGDWKLKYPLRKFGSSGENWGKFLAWSDPNLGEPHHNEDHHSERT